MAKASLRDSSLESKKKLIKCKFHENRDHILLVYQYPEQNLGHGTCLTKIHRMSKSLLTKNPKR